MGTGRSSTSTVHPHVHGERAKKGPDSVRFGGSSPRTWGTPVSGTGKDCGIRFIPTYMGNAGCCCWPPSSPPVHPHVHGERVSPHWKRRSPAGSSPRTWGTLVAVEPEFGVARFIPTYMGNATAQLSLNVCVSVHPHVHGERESMDCRSLTQPGSSPRTWGTHYIRCNHLGRGFVHPTYMGKRGDRARFVPVSGSSPYMGKHSACSRSDATPLSPRTGALHPNDARPRQAPHVHGERETCSTIPTTSRSSPVQEREQDWLSTPRFIPRTWERTSQRRSYQ